MQSIGRLSGIGNDEYMVFTHSTDSDKKNKQGALAVVRMGAKQNTRGYLFYGMPDGNGTDQNTKNRTVARVFSGNNHPGGISVLGKYVYVAQWCQDKGNEGKWCEESSASDHGFGFSVYDVSAVHNNSAINSNPPKHVHYHHAYNEPWIGTSSTASIAAVKLDAPLYLVALGKSGGKRYGFYLASSPTGPYVFLNYSDIGLYGENANFVTECKTGDIYMFQIEEYGKWYDNNRADKVHLYKLIRDNQKITFQKELSRTFHCRGNVSIDGAADWCNFDAGGGFYVTPLGKLVLYATEKEQSSHGNIRLIEFR